MEKSLFEAPNFIGIYPSIKKMVTLNLLQEMQSAEKS